ncbi:hypothetical protein HH214_10700 [Mucilaginibacter robiniae]|uniref:Quercetin 2,3-dioxygenase C-terminal cupin domain-containing protein n=1 Tax=Mucilaginibacter robiniae TaxID=2728022 RepID=A0A7L5E1W9_9SPHI|nr:hypothetical protein [Mucilaginibacter robiniae]QJD96299.1 hypothetical protein HH214_10700 [Mucilaginibacter robiniae]
MKILNPGQIYLADQRYLMETTAIRQYSIFNTGSFYREHQQPLGALQQLDDIILAGSKSTTLVADQPLYYVLLPITGKVSYQQNKSATTITDVGQLLLCSVPANTDIVRSNPYPANWINYLQIVVQNTSTASYPGAQTFHFDLDAEPDTLINITGSDYPFAISIGRFGGRREATYFLHSRQSRLFAFVITGAFELEGRLLHERDSLALWDIEEAELEALSNNAVIMLLEIKA